MNQRPYERKHLIKDLKRAERANDLELVHEAHAKIAPRRFHDLVDQTVAKIAVATNDVEAAQTIENDGLMNKTLQQIAFKHKNLDAVRAMSSTDWQRPTVLRLKEWLERRSQQKLAHAA